MDSKHGNKKFWSIIKTLTASKHVSSIRVVLEDEKTGNKINRLEFIAKKFNHYFCSVGKKLASKFDLAPFKWLPKFFN